MKYSLLGLCVLLSSLAFASTPEIKPLEGTTSHSQETSTSQNSTILFGLDLEFLVPDNLSGLILPQTLTGAHLGLSLGGDTLEFTTFYNSNQQTSTLILSEVDYRFNLSTPFVRGYALAGLHYLHFRIAFKDKDYVGPVIGFGFDLPMARNFKMGLQMKLYDPNKIMLGFGGGFTFLL